MQLLNCVVFIIASLNKHKLLSCLWKKKQDEARQLKYDQKVTKWHIFLHSVTFQDSFESMAELYLVKQISKYQLSTFLKKKNTLEFFILFLLIFKTIFWLCIHAHRSLHCPVSLSVITNFVMCIPIHFISDYFNIKLYNLWKFYKYW